MHPKFFHDSTAATLPIWIVCDFFKPYINIPIPKDIQINSYLNYPLVPQLANSGPLAAGEQIRTWHLFRGFSAMGGIWTWDLWVINWDPWPVGHSLSYCFVLKERKRCFSNFWYSNLEFTKEINSFHLSWFVHFILLHLFAFTLGAISL